MYLKILFTCALTWLWLRPLTRMQIIFAYVSPPPSREVPCVLFGPVERVRGHNMRLLFSIFQNLKSLVCTPKKADYIVDYNSQLYSQLFI